MAALTSAIQNRFLYMRTGGRKNQIRQLAVTVNLSAISKIGEKCDIAALATIKTHSPDNRDSKPPSGHRPVFIAVLSYQNAASPESSQPDLLVDNIQYFIQLFSRGGVDNDFVTHHLADQCLSEG